MIKPGDQITVTVETVFDGGFVTFYQDPSGNEHRGALLVDEKQMADSLARNHPAVFSSSRELANPLTVLHDHSYHPDIRGSVLEITRAVPSQVLLSWGCLPDVTAHSSMVGVAQHGVTQHGIARHGIAQHGVAQHGVASRELRTTCAEYRTGRAAVWCDPPKPTNHEPMRFPNPNLNSCFSRAAKSSAIYKIGVCMKTQQRSNFSAVERKRRRGKSATSLTQQSPRTSLLPAAAGTEYERESDRCPSLSSQSSESSSFRRSSSSSVPSPSPSPTGSSDTTTIREFSIKVPKLEMSDLRVVK